MSNPAQTVQLTQYSTLEEAEQGLRDWKLILIIGGTRLDLARKTMEVNASAIYLLVKCGISPEMVEEVIRVQDNGDQLVEEFEIQANVARRQKANAEVFIRRFEEEKATEGKYRIN